MLKKLLFMLLTLSLVFAIASCGGGGNVDCEVCVDENDDGVCDVCKKEMPEETVKDVVLFEDEDPTFQIVLADDLSAAVIQSVNSSIKAKLKSEHKITVNVITEGDYNDSVQDVEILIGEVNNRGEKYALDGYTLGKNGYAIQIADSKIIINAGSEDVLIETIDEFASEILIKEDLTNVVMTADDVIYRPQTGYKITAVKTNGNDMRGYTLAVDLTRDGYEKLATTIQETLYARAGYWLKIVDLENATDKSFVIKNIPKVSGKDSFKIYADGTQLVLECAYDNMLSKASESFVNNILFATGEINYTGTIHSQDISVLHYEDFGAKGDGVTDDFKAMYETHVMANAGGQPVYGTPGATYYIRNTKISVNGGAEKIYSIPIRTNTDWQGAKIIIDDTEMTLIGGKDPDIFQMGQRDIFAVSPDPDHAGFKFQHEGVLTAIVENGLRPGTTHIDLKIDGWDGPLFIIPYNTEHKIFRRKGYTSHMGEAMKEIIVIDENGNVSEETPIMFEYTNIDYMMVYKLDPSTAISVGNGVIETIESRVNQVVDGKFVGDGYTYRGINVTRSYTTLHDIEHIVTGGFDLKERAQNKLGPHSYGMFRATTANHVTFKDCKMPGRKRYTGSSYNFSGNSVNYIVLDNCQQTNFWILVDYDTGETVESNTYIEGAVLSLSSVPIDGVSIGMCWGIGGTNYCKNMQYIDSTLSRFDAHMGLYNGKIIRTNVCSIELTGVGEMIIEDSTWYQFGLTTPILFLRTDYGFHWDGDITLKNLDAYMFDVDGTPDLILAHYYYRNWYFGYTTAFPNITVDNLDLYSLKEMAPIDSYTGKLMNECKNKMHLSGNIGITPIFSYMDEDGDGYVDEPRGDFDLDGVIDPVGDLDGDGKIGNTSISTEDTSTWGKKVSDVNDGIPHKTSKINLNPVKPPSYIKIINNDGVDGNGGYTFIVPITSYKENGRSLGGFFGETKFIYGEGEGEYLLGSNHKNQTDTKTFQFMKFN